MSKRLLIIIIVLLVVAVGFGLYFVVMNTVGIPLSESQNSNTNSGTGNTTFKIQGMVVEVLKEGSGKESEEGDIVTVNYKAMLEDGKVFDSSYDRNVPFTFPLKDKTVIKGFYLGATGMKVGEIRKLTMPPELGYGENGFLAVPANA